MGREIRKVVKGWQHPKKENGYYQPLYDEYFEDAFNEWLEGRKQWIEGKNEKAKEYDCPLTTAGYIEWQGNAPNPECYRHVKWTEEEACCFQMYETVSEGTPVSEVFDTLKELEDWLVGQGHSRTAAANFCKSGSAPSMVIMNGVIKTGIDTCD